jgi:S1-C subfamily serine protease
MLVDILIILIVLGSIISNWSNNFAHKFWQFWSAIGAFAGLLLGRFVLEPHVVNLAHTPQSRAYVTVITIIGSALIGLTLGEYIGVHFTRPWHQTKLKVPIKILGSLIAAASVLLIFWLLAAAINRLPPSTLSREFKNSRIIAGLNNLLPAAPNVVSDLGNLIDPNGSPIVFIGNEPIPKRDVTLPSLGSLQSAVNADQASVVRIKGVGCGGIVSGSGFVVGKNLVATNAHVVSGISNHFVEDINGQHSSRLVFFDPDLDLALLRVNGLAGAPLKLDTAAKSVGTPSATIGYPGGGALSVSPSSVLDEILASGHNIYGNGVTLRDVYEIKANVVPGDSGSPLIEENGSVMGVVFAESTTYNDVGYALAMSKVASEINQNSSNQQTITTDQCAE